MQCQQSSVNTVGRTRLTADSKSLNMFRTSATVELSWWTPALQKLSQGVSSSWDCTVLYGIYIFTWLFFGSDARVFEEEAEKVKSEVQKPTARFIENKRKQIRRIAEKYNKEKAKIMKRNAEWEELWVLIGLCALLVLHLVWGQTILFSYYMALSNLCLVSYIPNGWN